MNRKTNRPSCSKLTMLLVNLPLNLWSLNMAYKLIFLLKKNVSSFCICKSYSHFFQQNTSEFDNVLTKTVNILTINKLIKLTMLWTAGPRKVQELCSLSNNKKKKKKKKKKMDKIFIVHHFPLAPFDNSPNHWTSPFGCLVMFLKHMVEWKHCRLWSEATFCCIWSDSTLFPSNNKG